MKVLVISSKYPPEYAGSGLRAHTTYRRLSEKYGIEFEVICNSVELGRAKTYTYEGVRVRRIAVGPLHRLLSRPLPGPLRRTVNALKCWVEAVTTLGILKSEQFDLVHVFGHSPSTTAGILWSRWRGKPLILELVNQRTTPFQFLPGASRFLRYRLDKHCIIVAISRYLGRVCANHSLTNNVWIRPNPVDEGRFYPDAISKAEVREEVTPFQADDKVLLYVAQFIPRKNHRFLLGVLSLLPERYKLVLAGPVVSAGPFKERDRGLVDSLRHTAAQKGLERRVLVLPGAVDTAKYLKMADVYCFPAYSEAMGTPLLESLCSGVPVVANADEPSFQEWIEDGVNGYLRPLKAPQWADAVAATEKMDQAARRAFSASITRRVSSGVIDAQYFALMEHLTRTSDTGAVDVSRVAGP